MPNDQPAGKGRKKGSGAKSGRKTPAPESVVPATPTQTVRSGVAGTAGSNAADAASQGGAAAAPPNIGLSSIAEADERSMDRSEAWHTEFTPISRNLVVEPRALTSLAAAMAQYESEDADHWPTQPSSSGIGVIAPVAGPVPALDSPEDVEPWGLSAVGNECVPIAIEGPTLASLQQPTYVKHISEGAAASIFSNVMSIVPLPTEPARPWCASRTFSRPTMHGLFADSPILAGSFISEYRGELLSTAAYRANPINQYAQVGTVKPHVHMFPPPLAVAIDARRFGTEARFARASCHPNAVLRPILFTRTGEAELVKSEDADHFSSLGPSFKRPEREPELLFGIFALTDIPRTHEITLGWEWDDEHIVHLLPSLVKDPALGLPPAPPGGEGASAAALAAAAIAAKVASGVRTTERERRSAAMATLAERGEFPYANARFAASMNAVLAVLLGMSLCACIGSAVPPGGQGGTASAHNSRKQDCAIAQMLRLAQGMAPLNVVMPGNKTHRKIRQPDFLPLVGVRRWWRPLSLTPTPEMTPDEVANRQRDLLLHHLDVPYKRTPTGHVGRVGEEDYLRAIAELKRTAKDVRKAELLPDIEDDRRSRASSLTEPLSGLSDLDEGDDEDDVSALLSNSGTIDLRPEESDPEDAWDAPRLLPHKKRVSGTRLKATYSGDEDSDAERAGAAGRRRASKVHTTPLPTPGLPTQQTARKATVTGVRKVSKAQGLLEQTRKLKSRGRPRKEATERASPRRVKMHDDSGDEGLRPRQSSKKKWRKSGKLHEPSSPLTSAPDDGKNYSSDESLSPAPTIQRKLSTQSERRNSLKHGDQSKMEEPLRADKVMLERPDKKRRASLIPSGSESERTARSVSPEKKAGGHERSKKKRKASEATSDLSESAIKRKNAKRLAASKMAKLQEKQKRLSLADIRDSESSGEEQPKLQLSPNKRQRSNSPEKKMVRASVKAKKPRLIISTDESGLEEDLTPGATVAQVQNAASFESSPVVEEGSAFDSQVPRAMESQSRVGDLAFTQTPDTAPPPARVEPPRAKLTLAEYKKRLAERQANEAAASAAPPTPSEVPPSPLETLTAEQSRLGPPTSGVPPSGMEVQHSAVGAGDFLASRYAPPAPRPPRPATPPRSVPPSPIAQSVYSSVPPGAAPGQIPSYSSFAQRASLADFSQPPAPAQSQMTVDASTGRQQLNVGTGMHSPQTGFAPDHVRADSSFVNDDVRSRGDSMSPRKSVSGAWLMGNATSPVRAAPPAPLASDHIGADGAGNRSIFRPGFRPVVPPSPIASDMPSLRPPQTPTSAPRPPAAPAAFNPPRGPKALINASAPTASPSVAAASSAFSGRSEDISPIVGARRMHSNSVSNASASSMSPPAHGSRLPSAATGPPGNPVDVGGSRSSSGSFSVEPGAPPGTYAARPTAIDDFAGVPRGPRGSEDGFVDASHTIPAPREGAGAGIASGSPASMPFRGRGRGWMGGGSRGFPRGGGWGGRARGDMRRGRGRGW
ncbi:PHD Zn-finger proteins [Ceraceosorus bombacis]|uniref:PHD Zn-finger proteins n=1 Tax=Ceraceosorus bombacis TaxID=401625 RepID=A0A0N7L9J4_9BASI|nr:PHD Zn-finger proteins [Ceraceosorus bombacis]